MAARQKGQHVCGQRGNWPADLEMRGGGQGLQLWLQKAAGAPSAGAVGLKPGSWSGVLRAKGAAQGLLQTCPGVAADLPVGKKPWAAGKTHPRGGGPDL